MRQPLQRLAAEVPPTKKRAQRTERRERDSGDMWSGDDDLGRFLLSQIDFLPWHFQTFLLSPAVSRARGRKQTNKQTPNQGTIVAKIIAPDSFFELIRSGVVYYATFAPNSCVELIICWVNLHSAMWSRHGWEVPKISHGNLVPAG